jgi:cytochrome c peroxidase
LLVALPGSALAGELTLAIEPRWRQEKLELPARLVNDAGQALRITRLAALVSGVTLLRSDGSSVRLEGQYGFINVEGGRREVRLRGVPEEDYVGLEFQVGVPPEVNHANPGQWPAGHVLNPVVDGLHWSWQGGYVFLALEGRWHERGAATGGAERGFSYHLATDARRMRVGFRANFHVERATTIELAFDVARVLAGLRLSPADGSESTHSAENDELASRLTGAVERAWFWLGTAPTPARAIAAESAREVASVIGTPYPFSVPAGFPQPALPVDNPLTREGVALGEALFSDARLSINGAQSCASCHAPARAFSDTVALSLGAEGKRGARNAMPLVNLAWSSSYAWDGGQARIRDQAHAAWINPIEMHADPAAVIALLARDAALVAKFRAAFGTPEITAERVTLALEQYLLTIVSADSRFDRALRGGAPLTDEEQRGFELFAMEFDPARGRRGADCFHCHGGALFTDFTLKNNGLDLASADAGRAKVTANASERGKFKTPSLRNVAVTAPYMHDGRFATLEEVVAHYDHGVKRAAALDPNLAKHPDEGLRLSAADQRALVAFLKTLTDARFAVGVAR